MSPVAETARAAVLAFVVLSQVSSAQDDLRLLTPSDPLHEDVVSLLAAWRDEVVGRQVDALARRT
jgi:hypothetical protein